MNKEAKFITKLAQMKLKENQITKHYKDKLRGIGIFLPKRNTQKFPFKKRVKDGKGGRIRNRSQKTFMNQC